MRRGSLEIRLTHKYVDSCKEMDDYEEIGDWYLTSSEYSENIDGYNDRTAEHRVIVYSDRTDEEIIKALNNEFGHWGCSHEYDCCGCQLIRVEDVEKQDYSNGLSFKSIWCVKTFITHNY